MDNSRCASCGLHRCDWRSGLSCCSTPSTGTFQLNHSHFRAPSVTICSIQQLIVLVAIYFSFVAILVSSYVYTQVVDPVNDNKACCTLPLAGRNNKQEKRYCSVCKKSVPGLDHHCKWLGTCVGRRNYLSFYMLAGFGFFTVSRP